MTLGLNLKYFFRLTLTQRYKSYNMLQHDTLKCFLIQYFLFWHLFPITFKIKTMDVLVRNKKTGVEKTVPEKVYESLKHLYVKIGDAEPEPELKKKDETSQNAPVVDAEPPVVIENGVETQIQLSNAPEVSEGVSEYEALSGKKPDGRWSPAKLAEKIQELKNAKNEA